MSLPKSHRKPLCSLQTPNISPKATLCHFVICWVTKNEKFHEFANFWLWQKFRQALPWIPVTRLSNGQAPAEVKFTLSKKRTRFFPEEKDFSWIFLDNRRIFAKGARDFCRVIRPSLRSWILKEHLENIWKNIWKKLWRNIWKKLWSIIKSNEIEFNTTSYPSHPFLGRICRLVWKWFFPPNILEILFQLIFVSVTRRRTKRWSLWGW